MSLSASLRCFACAARAMSFTEAARLLGISQPALSESIRRMEGELGVRLFDRTTRSLALTPEGRALAGLAEEVARDVREGVADIVARGARRPRVTIALLPSIAAALLPPAADALRQDFPDAELNVCDVLHERAVALVEDGIADLAVTMRPMGEHLAYEPLARTGCTCSCAGAMPSPGARLCPGARSPATPSWRSPAPPPCASRWMRALPPPMWR